ncbi:MAG: endolytic transglycosylase MltG, partial [Actinobacteria bacterium]|nr:endolytic transglycosylase MltG [Actinomycetota bacterium]
SARPSPPQRRDTARAAGGQPPIAPRPPRKVTDDDIPAGTVSRPGSSAPPTEAQLDSPQRRRRSPGRHALLFAIVAVAAVAILYVLNGIFEPFKGQGTTAVSVSIPAGANAGDVGQILADNGVVDSRFFFELRATLGGDRGNLRAGRYKFAKGMSNGAALSVLTTEVRTAPVIDVLVPEGPGRKELAPVVAKQGVSGSYVAASRSSSQLNPSKYGAPKGTKSLEGFLFPATYELLRSAPTAESLVSKQLVAFKDNFAGVDMSYAKSKNLTDYDVLILASIIEREALFDVDRPLVSAVFYNRLRESISLGSDATTRYSINNWDQPLTVSQLNNPSPYNTRRFPGLPPGPIGNPGLASIKAAAKPPKSDYMFFIVATCQKGRLAFARTATEFQKLIDAYNNKRASQGGKDPAFCR